MKFVEPVYPLEEIITLIISCIHFFRSLCSDNAGEDVKSTFVYTTCEVSIVTLPFFINYTG